MKSRQTGSVLIITLIVLLLCSLLINGLSWFQYYTTQSTETRIVDMSLLLSNFPNSTMNELLNWLEQVGYRKWTLILEPWSNGTDSNAFYNETFIDELKQYGELAPVLPFGLQNYPPEYRKQIVDSLYDFWEKYVGYNPAGFFQFQPDTYTCNYILSRGSVYWQGYCFDQYLIDWMSMRGGWQMPYYASEGNALVPKREGSGLVILPHNTWDWRASFEYNHGYNTHLLNAMDMFNQNYTATLKYLTQLIYRTLSSTTPFGYVSIQHEWLWMRQNGLLDDLKNYTQTVMASQYTFQTFNETANWFKQHYASNPSYYVNFNTPYGGGKVEWLWNTNCRITRYDGRYVVGYVDYTQQETDPYINSTANCDYQAPANDTNCIWTSLKFLVDDFGNAPNRAPPKGHPIIFTGPLDNFPSYFARLSMKHGN